MASKFMATNRRSRRTREEKQPIIANFFCAATPRSILVNHPVAEMVIKFDGKLEI
jgi:hypothetical protein